MGDIALLAAVFLACLVEATEATTIVVAVGATRSWRSALTGTVVAAVVLAIVVAVVGPAILLLPLSILRIVIGGLLLIFGLQWLRKAVLRAAGIKSLHDEDAIYQRHVAEANSAAAERRAGVDDWYAFTVAFKGVLLEGLEVVFIVLTFATNQHDLGGAVIAAAAAVVVIVILGVIVRGPLSRVPENTLKYVVGVMLTSFGLFWGAEGVGARWPGSDAALLVIAPAILVFCLLLTFSFRRRRLAAASASAGTSEPLVGPSDPAPATSPATSTATAPVETREPGRLKQFGLFAYDYVVGDDWQIAAGVVVLLVITGLASGWAPAWLIPAVAVVLLIPYGTARAARS